MNTILNFKTVKIFLPVLSTLLIGSCSSILNSYSVKDKDFWNYNKLSIVSVNVKADKISEQEITDVLTVEFMKKDYNLIERSKIKMIMDERVLAASGLTEQSKSALKVSGINAIVTGSFTGSQVKVLPVKDTDPVLNECNVSISLKMLDVNTGEIIWAANGSLSGKDADLTEQKLFRDIVHDLQDKIPSARKPKFLFFF
jgi:curli biogenesis system outer membrane secretion channel CsgG